MLDATWIDGSACAISASLPTLRCYRVGSGFALDYVEVHRDLIVRGRISYKTSIKLTSKVRELSKGMHLALVMAIDAKLLVLDEPTLGLDILYHKQFYDSLLNDYFDRSH